MPIIQHLIVDEFGTFVHKHEGRLQVERLKTGEKLVQAPLIHLEQVLITSNGVSISTDAVRACAEAGIPIHFISGSGTPYASIVSVGLVGTVQTRRAQMLAYHDSRGLHLARAFALGKIENQARLIRYAAKYRREKDPALYQELQLLAGEILDHRRDVETASGSCVDEARSELLSAEGRAAQKYWAAIRLLLRDEMDWHPGCDGSSQYGIELRLWRSIWAGGTGDFAGRAGAVCRLSACGSAGEAEPSAGPNRGVSGSGSGSDNP